MIREEAINEIKSWAIPSEKGREVLETLIPELKESEDERIRKELIEFIKWSVDRHFMREDFHQAKRPSEWIAYLEKQKENPKSTNSIPVDCVSDAKCEDRWQKVQDSLPDNPREVICKDSFGNYFIGRYYGEEHKHNVWTISVYDDEDKTNEYNPEVVEWCEIPSEKQKEQNPVEDKELLKNILFQKKGITYDDYKCKNDPYVGLSFYELIKCLEEYDKERSNR